MLSVIIPSYKDPMMRKTVESLLKNAKGEIEIIVVLDGYWAEPFEDKRVIMVHQQGNRGMRESINTGVSIAKGEHILRTDEHCMFAEGYDIILTRDCEDKMIMIPRRYFLDVDNWKVIEEEGFVDYEKLLIDPHHNKFTGSNWKSRTAKRIDAKYDIDETLAFQGSCWVMKKSWWEKVIVDLQTEGYGPLYQDSHEMSFKTWRAGGRIMVNKRTWFAHKHRSFKRTHQYGTEQARPGWQYAIDLWKKDYEIIKEKWKI